MREDFERTKLVPSHITIEILKEVWKKDESINNIQGTRGYVLHLKIDKYLPSTMRALAEGKQKPYFEGEEITLTFRSPHTLLHQLGHILLALTHEEDKPNTEG